MSFLRRGSLRVPRKYSYLMRLHRVDGQPFNIPIRFIQCWEEHQLSNRSKVTVVYWGINSSTTVRESFAFVDAMANEMGVPHVEA